MEDVPKKPNRADIPSCILVEKVWRAFCAVLVVTYFGCCGACLFAAATGAEIAVFTTDLQTDIVLVGTCLLGIFALSWLLKVFLVRYIYYHHLVPYYIAIEWKREKKLMELRGETYEEYAVCNEEYDD